MLKHSLFLIACTIIAGAGRSQAIITGRVVDSVSRQPLEAAFVSQTGSSNKATALTDKGGNFLLKLNKMPSGLQVSFIGYKPAVVYTAGSRSLLVALQPDVPSLKDVVVLQSNHPPDFSTLSKIDLDLKPVRNTQELLRLVPGLFIAQHAGGGKAEQIFLRGFDCDHGTDVQVSVDGIPVNMVSHAHGQGYADAHFIIPETVQLIDYGAGPYYSAHGNLNTAGYVAFSTLNNLSRSQVQLEAGRYNTYRALAMLDLLKKNKDKQSAYVAADFYYTNGPTINKQNFNRFNILGKYNLALSASTSLHAMLSAFKSKWDASGQVPERAVESGLTDRFGSIDPTEGGHTERHNASATLTHLFKGGSSWENQAYYSRYLFNLYSNFTFYLNDPVNGDEINQAEGRHVAGYTSRLARQSYIGNWSLHSIYAAGFRYDATRNSRLSHVVKRRFLNDVQLGDIHEANGFGYTEQQLSRGKWLIDGGLRWDYLHFDYTDKVHAAQPDAQGKAILSPKLNFQYTINPKVQLFVKTGKGFHSNDTRVVVARSGREILPAAYGADLGIILKPVNQLLINVAAWYLHLDQEFVYAGDDGNIEPSGKTRRQGLDVIVRYQFSKNLFAHANINLTKPRAIGPAKGEDYIPLAPTLTSTGGLYYKRSSGFNGSLSSRYIRRRPANEDNTITARGYFLLDGAVNYTRRSYELGVSVENALNADWNEAQFATESRLRGEPASVTELNFTPGTPFFFRAKLAVFF